MFGPACGFILGSLCTKFYVDAIFIDTSEFSRFFPAYSSCPLYVGVVNQLLPVPLRRYAGHHSRRPAVDRSLVGRLPPVRCLTLLLRSLDVWLPTVAADQRARGGGRQRASYAPSFSESRLRDSKAQQRDCTQP